MAYTLAELKQKYLDSGDSVITNHLVLLQELVKTVGETYGFPAFTDADAAMKIIGTDAAVRTSVEAEYNRIATVLTAGETLQDFDMAVVGGICSHIHIDGVWTAKLHCRGCMLDKTGGVDGGGLATAATVHPRMTNVYRLKRI